MIFKLQSHSHRPFFDHQMQAMHGQSYQSGGYVPQNNQRMNSCPPNAMNGPMSGPMMGHMNSMSNQMHNPNMMTNSNVNGMNQSMTMNGQMTMNKTAMNNGVQAMPGMTGPSNGMYAGGPGGPRARPGPYTNPQQYMTQKRQYTNPNVQPYNSGPVMQSYGSVPQSPVNYNSNQVSSHHVIDRCLIGLNRFSVCSSITVFI